MIIPSSVAYIKIQGIDGCSNLIHVYYAGTSEQWNSIQQETSAIGAINESNLYYYSEAEPNVAGLYWHYVEAVPIIWDI